MTDASRVNLRQYYANFKSLSGVLAGSVTAFPLFAYLIRFVTSEGMSAYLFPPIGIAEGPARIGAIVMAMGSTYLAFFLFSKRNKTDHKWPASLLLGAMVSIFVYIGLYSRFVRTIEIPTLNKSVTVSVGYERTEFANRNFGSVSDWELLRQRGTSEEEISMLWTGKSLQIVRLAMYGSYCLFLVLFVLAFSLGVLSESE